MLSAIFFTLDESKVLSSGNGLTDDRNNIRYVVTDDSNKVRDFMRQKIAITYKMLQYTTAMAK